MKKHAAAAARTARTFTLDADNNVTIGVGEGYHFMSAEMLACAASSLARLIVIYNDIPGIEKPVKRFMDRATGARRTWDALNAWADRVERDRPVLDPLGIYGKPKKAAAKAAKKTAAGGDRKKDMMIALLSEKEPCSIERLMSAAGWQRHSVRGFIAGYLKKNGYTVASAKNELGERTYHIEA